MTGRVETAPGNRGCRALQPSRAGCATTTCPHFVIMTALPFPFLAPLRGVSFHQPAVSSMTAGDRVRVEHEPDNEHDNCAMRVTDTNGTVLGYLPAALAARAVAALGTGVRLDAVVEAVYGEKTRGMKIRVLGVAVLPVVEERPSIVRTRSGRVLGFLLAVRGDLVDVEVAGRAVPYPSSLVVVDESGHEDVPVPVPVPISVTVPVSAVAHAVVDAEPRTEAVAHVTTVGNGGPLDMLSPVGSR